MELAEREKRRKKLMPINHYLVGLGLILKGVDKLDHYDHFPYSVIYFFAAGVFIIICTKLHHQIEKYIKKFDASFFVLEGLALILASFILFEREGAKIPYFFFFLGMVYFIIGFTVLLSNEKNMEKVFGILQKVLAVLFIAAAAISLILNFIFSFTTWIYIMAAIMAGVGIFLLKAEKILTRYQTKSK